jgi:ribose 5-phosphate isomerase A
MNPKQRAAEAAIPFINSGMVLGLGTGTTADFFLIALGAAIASGKLTNISGIPTSQQSEYRAMELGIPLTTLARSPVIDVTVDGADEVTPQLDLIKGLGGALIREKIVAQSSRKLIIIVDQSKRVEKLGSVAPLPVEVLPFAHEIHENFFRSLGGEPKIRKHAGMVFNTDNGNLIYDVRFPPMNDPAQLEHALQQRAGIVGSGLFLNLATTVLIADENAVTQVDRKDKR